MKVECTKVVEVSSVCVIKKLVFLCFVCCFKMRRLSLEWEESLK